MKLKDYIRHLQELHHHYGDVAVKFSTTYEVIGIGDFEYETDYTKAEKPYYDNENNCVIIHKEFKSFD